MSLRKYCFLLLILWSLTGHAQQIQFANIYYSNHWYEIFNFIELKDSSYIICGKKETGLSTPPERQFLLHIKSNGDTLDSHEFFIGYITDIVSFNDSVVTILPVGWNQLSAINLVNININSYDSSNFHTYGSQGWTGGIVRYNDNGYVMSNISAGNYGIIKLDSNFNVQWHQSTNFPSKGQLLIDSLSNILVTCLIGNNAIQPYAYSYFDSSGTLLWSQSYGNNQAQLSNTFINGTVITSDSNFLAFTGGDDWQMMKINRLTGDTMWTKQFPEIIDCGFSFTPNRHYVFSTWAGQTKKWLIDDEGAILSSSILPFFVSPIQAHKTMDGGFALCGTWGTGPPQWIQLPALIKFDSLGNTVSTSIFNPDNNFAPLAFYPNPARDEIFINAGSMAAEKNAVFTLSDMEGRRVLQQAYGNNGAIDISVVPAGLYIATLRGKEKELRGKVKVEK